MIPSYKADTTAILCNSHSTGDSGNLEVLAGLAGLSGSELCFERILSETII